MDCTMHNGCRCRCGYTCGRGNSNLPKCTLSFEACMDQHYVVDCDHQWDGETLSWEDEDGRGGGFSVTCSKCGTDRLGHDMAVGP